MNRRAGDMRTYAQDTALPGGKYEEGDVDAEGTAVRLPSSEKSSLTNRDEKLMKRYIMPHMLNAQGLTVDRPAHRPRKSEETM
jgi:coenzyme A diphosphatase NUDT7